jgi:chromosome segregation ATPase
MKTIKLSHYSLFLLLSLTFFSCENYEEQLAQAKSEYDALLAQTQSKDSAMLNLVTTFNEIDENLQAIKEKEKIINSNLTSEGVPKDHQQRILDDIQSIYSMMESNKAKVQELNEKLRRVRRQLKNSDQKLDAATKQLMEYEKMISSLTKQLEQKDVQIAKLTTQLTKLNFELDSLRSEYLAATSLNELQEGELNTAYYVFDTKKSLKENNVIESKGGVVGIGSTKALKQDFNKSYFTKINIQETKSISLYAKKAELLTNHPTEAYDLVEKDGQIEKIIIKDPTAFWGTSKYLVIQTD